MKRIVSFGAVLLASMAATAPAAMATTTTLHEGSATGPEVATGTAITATGVAAKNLVFHTSVGNIECTSNVLNGKLETNSAEIDTAKIETTSFTGTEGSTKKECKTTISLLGDPTAAITANSPWQFEFAWWISVLKFWGKIKTGGSTPVSFTAKLSDGVTCIFGTSVVEDTSTAGPPLLVSVSKQAMKKEAGSGSLCPSEGELNGEFLLKTAAGAELALTHT